MNKIKVVTSVKLDNAMKERIERLFGAKYSDYQIEYCQDKDILGGILIYDGDTVYDGSVLGQLDKIKKALV